MTKFLTTLFLFLCLHSFAQKGQCFCADDSTIESPGITCDTTFLSDHSKLYWQYNCEEAWLTLEKSNGQKLTLDNFSSELYGQAIRVGYEFIKEYEKSILFRGGCTSNEYCLYMLIDKNTGKEINLFNQLICIYTEDNQYKFDFVVYLSDTTEHLIIHYIDSDKILKVPFKEKFTEFVEIALEDHFETMTLENNILTINYESDAHEKKKLTIDLNDKKYSR